jgi:uncharacterized membrane protein
MNIPAGTTAARKHSFVHLTRQWWAVGVLALAVLILVAAPWPLMDKLFAIAYGICPQRSAHSLFFGGQQMSIEARMFGMFGGAVAAALYLAARGRGKATGLPRLSVLAVLIGFVAWMGLDGVNALLFDLHLPHLYAPNLTLRLGTGLLTGLSIGAADRRPQSNDLVARGTQRASASGWRDLLGVLGIVPFYSAVADWVSAPLSPLDLGFSRCVGLSLSAPSPCAYSAP